MSVEQIHVSTPEGKSTISVLTYGATVLSWKRDGQEQLFLSSKAKLDGSAAVRGGIPLVFPVFSDPKQPVTGTLADYPPKLAEGVQKASRHGFARSTVWKYLGAKDGAPGEKVLEFTLDTDDHKEIYEWYPWHVQLTYEVRISDATPTLTTALHVHNLAPQAAPFHALFHSYLLVKSAETVAVEGLQGSSSVDTADEYKVKPAPAEPIVLHGDFIDKVFYDIGGDVKLVEDGRTLSVHNSSALPDVTVWNPAEAGAAGMGDMHAGGWNEFMCIEPGSIKGLNYLEPNKTWTGEQTLTVSN